MISPTSSRLKKGRLRIWLDSIFKDAARMHPVYFRDTQRKEGDANDPYRMFANS